MRETRMRGLETFGLEGIVAVLEHDLVLNARGGE